MIIPILILAQMLTTDPRWQPGMITPPAVQGKPLTCGKYQHVFHRDAYVGGVPCTGGACVTIAVGYPEVNECVDDMHEITERDWQALMDRITKLESKK